MRVEDLINELEDMMNDAKVLPLTGGKAVVDTEAVLDILDDIQDALPGEMKKAANGYVTDLMKRADETLTDLTNEIRKTRQDIQAQKKD